MPKYFICMNKVKEYSIYLQYIGNQPEAEGFEEKGMYTKPPVCHFSSASICLCHLALHVHDLYPVFVAPAARLKLLLSFAVGGLLGDVFLHLLPEAWQTLQGNNSVHL